MRASTRTVAISGCNRYPNLISHNRIMWPYQLQWCEKNLLVDRRHYRYCCCRRHIDCRFHIHHRMWERGRIAALGISFTAKLTPSNLFSDVLRPDAKARIAFASIEQISIVTAFSAIIGFCCSFLSMSTYNRFFFWLSTHYFSHNLRMQHRNTTAETDEQKFSRINIIIYSMLAARCHHQPQSSLHHHHSFAVVALLSMLLSFPPGNADVNNWISPLTAKNSKNFLCSHCVLWYALFDLRIAALRSRNNKGRDTERQCFGICIFTCLYLCASWVGKMTVNTIYIIIYIRVYTWQQNGVAVNSIWTI